MEAIADLIPFAIIVAFWLLRAIRGNKQKQARRPVESGEPSAPTPFEQLMRQLEEALEEPTPRNTSELDAAEPSLSASDAEPVPPARLDDLPGPGDVSRSPLARPVKRQAEREPAMRAAPRPPRAVPVSFEPPASFEASFDHERHGFGAENPLSEESFEQRPAFAPRSTKPKPKHDPHALRSGRSTRKQTPRRGASAWAQRLHDPAAAREALVLKTIFEGPWKPRSGRKER